MVTTSSLVVGVAEREVETNETAQALESGASTASGTAERTITGTGVVVVTDASDVVGAGGRKVTGSGALAQDATASGNC